MNRIYFDLGVFTYWSEESLDNRRLVSKGGVLVSDGSAPVNTEDDMDPELREMLRNLRAKGYELNICDTLPSSDIIRQLEKFDIKALFYQVVSGRTEESIANSLAGIRRRDDFSVFVGCDPVVIGAAEQSQIPVVAYGENMAEVRRRALGYAVSPIGIEDQLASCTIIHEVARKTIEKKARILGIDGIDFAGKKFFARKLGKYFDLLGKEYTIVNLEDFHRSVEETYKGEDPVESYYFNGFNHEKLIGEVLDPFVKTGSLDRTVYCLDRTNDAFINERHYRISPDGVMILIGPMMYREPLLRYFDVTVFMRVDYKESEHRASLMDTPIYGEDPLEVYRNKNIPAQKMYVQLHDPSSGRDFVIDNSNYHRPVIVR
ncbi:MAG: hypothetical protein J5750_03975 [Clostridiales bacterium]|nr:hypothetical protein [Clostridiales bacterium]